MNSAIPSLVLTAGQHGVELSVDRLMHENALDEGSEITVNDLLKIAGRNRLKVRHLKSGWNDVVALGEALPVIIHLNNGRYVILSSVNEEDGKQSVSILDPISANKQLQSVLKDDFMAAWSGDLILLKSRFSLRDDEQSFSLRWILKEFYTQKVLLIQTVMITMLLHVFTVLPIIYIMIVLDKVVNYQAYSTLYVIAIGVLVGHLFAGIFGYLKQYISLFFVSKLEAKLNMKTFSKVMDQSLTYFQSNDSARVVKTVQQVDTIRHFITHKIFGTLFDASALLIYIPILLLFSPTLFIVVLLFSLTIALNNIWGSKQQKNLVNTINNYESLKQKTLNNSITGIDSVKTLALEATLKRDWETASTSHTLATLELGKLNARSSQISATLQQIMTVIVIFIGVLMVFSGDLSAGVLIGVNMLAGKITGPLVKLVTMSTELEKFSTAINLLKGVLNNRGEYQSGGSSPVIEGASQFKNVSFGYNENKMVLKNISFSIDARKSVAIVGPSGSGKTTLLRLMQGLLSPQEGTIMIDGDDIRMLDKEHLRLNVCMVGTKHSFFTDSIRENVMNPMPMASRERLFWAYNMAGLTDDIAELPDGGETKIEEDGGNLPTSMLNKIVLARALIRNPRVLMLDESLSGLSVDDEISILNKLPEIKKGRTLMVATHQLSQVVDFDQILVLSHEGELVEQGSHADLMELKGAYFTQWAKEQSIRGMQEVKEND